MQKIAWEIKDIAMPPNINIVFLWNINRKEVLDILAKTDIFLYSTFQETFGIAIIEAMNFGIPVVLNNYGLFYELYNKEFIAKNKWDFIYKLGKLTSDKTYYKDYVNKWFKELEKFDKTKTINKWHELIKEKIS